MSGAVGTHKLKSNGRTKFHCNAIILQRLEISEDVTSIIFMKRSLQADRAASVQA